MGDYSKEAYYWLYRCGKHCITGIDDESKLPESSNVGNYYNHIDPVSKRTIGMWIWYNNKWNYTAIPDEENISATSYEGVVQELEDKIQLLVDIVLKKDIQYEAWIKKNIGDRYVQQR